MTLEDVPGLKEAVILCGGLGTRLRPVVADRPKAMVKVHGRPFVEWLLIRLARRDGINHVVLATGYLGNMIEAHLGRDRWCGIELTFSRETRPLGTAGALRLAMESTVTSQVLVVNGDTWCFYDCPRLLQLHVAQQAVATIWLDRMPHASRYAGVRIDSTGRITDFAVKPVADGSSLVSAGVYIIDRRAVTGIAAGCTVSLERDTFPALVRQGLYGLEGDRPFVDIGTPDALECAAAALASDSHDLGRP